MSVMAAGPIVSAVGSVVGGFQQRQMAQAQASSLKQQANTALAIGSAEGGERARQGRALAARQEAGAAASGGGATGSALDVIANDAVLSELDAMRAVASGIGQANVLRSKAKRAKQKGRNAMIGGVLKATASLLSAPAGAFGGTQAAASVRASTPSLIP